MEMGAGVLVYRNTACVEDAGDALLFGRWVSGECAVGENGRGGGGGGGGVP